MLEVSPFTLKQPQQLLLQISYTGFVFIKIKISFQFDLRNPLQKHHINVNVRKNISFHDIRRYHHCQTLHFRGVLKVTVRNVHSKSNTFRGNETVYLSIAYLCCVTIITERPRLDSEG